MYYVELIIFRDRGKPTEFAEYTMLNGIAYFRRKRHFMSPNPLISLPFFINFNPYPVDSGKCVTLTVLVAAYALSTSDRGIFLFWKFIEMT